MEAAQQAFEEGITFYPTSTLYSGLALVHRTQKNWLAERAALQNQLQTDAGNTYVHYRLGLLLTILDSGHALTELTAASSLDPEFDPAVQTLRTALDLSATQPDPSQQSVTIGRALGLLQEWDLSLSAFENAVELSDKNAEAWAWLGEAKQQTGLDGRAELDKALMLDGRSAIVRGLRGLYWSRQGKYSQSLAEYLLAAGIEPENPAWQAAIGEARTNLGDLASALAAYQKATELAPGEPTYWRLLAILCAENDTWVEETGLPAAQKAAELAPENVAVLDTLGWSYLQSGRYFTAEQTLLDALAHEPDYLPAHLHLAMTYLAQGNRDSAFNKLVYIRDTDPNGETGQFASQLLEQYFP
jgi:tetratricopeptide (TPR) repeat protein